MKRAILLALILVGVMVAQTTHSITITWPPGTGATSANTTSFGILKGTAPGGESPTPIATVPFVTGQASYTYTDSSGLIEGQQYCYEIEATGPGGTSAPSPETCATVPFSAPPTPGKPTLTVK